MPPLSAPVPHPTNETETMLIKSTMALLFLKKFFIINPHKFKFTIVASFPKRELSVTKVDNGHSQFFDCYLNGLKL